MNSSVRVVRYWRKGVRGRSVLLWPAPLMVSMWLGGALGVASAQGSDTPWPETDVERLVRLSALGDARGVDGLLQEGAKVSAKEPVHGATALHNAAAQGHVKVTDLLFERGASIDAADHVGATPLVYAAYRGHVTAVSALLDHGASVDVVPSSGPTALTAACLTGRSEIVGLLLRAGADASLPDGNGVTPIAAASVGDREGILQQLSQAIDGREPQ